MKTMNCNGNSHFTALLSLESNVVLQNVYKNCNPCYMLQVNAPFKNQCQGSIWRILVMYWRWLECPVNISRIFHPPAIWMFLCTKHHFLQSEMVTSLVTLSPILFFSQVHEKFMIHLGKSDYIWSIPKMMSVEATNQITGCHT